MQNAHGLRRRLLDGVGHRDQAGDFAVHGGEHDGLALASALVRGSGQGARINIVILHQPAVADEHRTAVDRAAHAFAGDRVEVVDVHRLDAALVGALDDRTRQRMFAGIFQRSDELQ